MGIGAAASNALWDFMAQREKDRRQAFVDAISKQGADRQDRELVQQGEQFKQEHERSMAQLDLNKKQLELQAAADKRATQAAERQEAETITKTTAPGAKLQPGQAQKLRGANMGGLIRTPPVDIQQMESPAAVAALHAQGVDMNAEPGAEFAGSINYQQGMAFAKELRERGEGDKADFIEAQLRTGDSSMAAGPFTDPKMGIGTVHANGRVYNRVFNPQTGGFDMVDVGAETTTAQKMGELLAGGPSAWEKIQGETRLSILDSVISRADGYTTGIGGKLLGWMPGSEAMKFKQDSKALMSSIASKALSEMRRTAQEMGQKGSGLGQVTERELDLLEQSLGALSTEMSPDAFKANARAIQARLIRLDELHAQFEAQKAAKAKGGKQPAIVAPPAEGRWTTVDGVRVREKQ